MKKLLFSLFTFFIVSSSLIAQQYIAAIQDPFVVLLNSENGEVINEQFINMSALNPTTPKGIRQVGNEIWITDQIDDTIYRFDLDGEYISQISGNMDNIKGLNVIDGAEVWVTNAGTGNGAPGDAIVRFDTNGNYLSHFMTSGRSSFDILDVGNGEVYISYISGGSPIEKRDYSGNFISFIVNPNTINFAQQIWLAQDGNLLVGTFSGTSGIYSFDPETGSQTNFWALPDVRGVIETGNQNILWSNSSGIHLLDTNSGSSTLIKPGVAQYFALVDYDIEGDQSCTTPILTISGQNEICESETITLTANTNGEEVYWYDSETSTIPIASGTEFTTPELVASTSYWAKAVNYGEEGDGEIIEGGARLSPSSSSSSNVVSATSPWGLSFDTTEDFTIVSVDVYLASSTPGNLVMRLLDENWQILEETTVSCPAGNSSNPVQFEVPLNFSVEANKTYRLVAAQSPVMVREFSSEHTGFPYPIGNVGTVTGGTINNSNSNNIVYYFFYNWTVQTGSVEICESDRVEFAITVNPSPAMPTGEEVQYFTQGQTLSDLIVNTSGDLNWYADENGTTPLPENTELVDSTTYFVSQTIDGCESELFAITVYLTMSTNDLNGQLFSIYPNPVIDKLFINGKQNIHSIEIFDESGRKHAQFKNIINGTLDLKNLKSGIYLLKIYSDNSSQTIKVIKK